MSVDGTPIKRPGPDRAVVFQQFALFPWKSVYDNIDLGLRNLNVGRADRESRIAAILDLMNLTQYAKHFPHQLFGRDAAARGDCARLCAGPDVFADGRKLSGALDAQDPFVVNAGRNWSGWRARTRAPCCSSPMTWRKPVYLAPAWAIIDRRAPGTHRIKEAAGHARVRNA